MKVIVKTTRPIHIPEEKISIGEYEKLKSVTLPNGISTKVKEVPFSFTVEISNDVFNSIYEWAKTHQIELLVRKYHGLSLYGTSTPQFFLTKYQLKQDLPILTNEENLAVDYLFGLYMDNPELVNIGAANVFLNSL